MSLKEALKKIEKDHGKGTLMRMGDREALDLPVISSGSLALDIALGIGGYPRGRIIEAYGPEAGGKTTLALHAVAQAQALGLTVAYVDAEHALDPKWAETIGVNVDDLYISQPDNGEQALGVLDTLVRSGEVGLIVVDSVAALTPKAELDGTVGDAHMGLLARLMSQAMRMLAGNAQRTNTTLYFINQIRMKIGVFFGSPETTPGGLALRFAASQRLDIRRIGSVKDGDEIVANTVRVKVKKNKVAPPFTEATFDLRFNQGIDYLGELVDLGVAFGHIKKSGSWLEYAGQKLQGKDAMKGLFRNADVAKTLRDKILESARERS